MTEQDKELQTLRKKVKELEQENDRLFRKSLDLDITDCENDIRGSILKKAIECVCSDREDQYGTPEDSFSAIAKLWTAYYGEVFYPDDVAIMMTLLKIARIKTGRYKDDSYIDAAGYIACAAEIAQSKGW